MKQEVGEFTHTIFNTAIVIKNVPYYHCDSCGESFYVSDRQVESTLKEAYRRNEKICEYHA